MLAAIRGPGQDFPVLLHIVGATVVFGALLASAMSIAEKMGGLSSNPIIGAAVGMVFGALLGALFGMVAASVFKKGDAV